MELLPRVSQTRIKVPDRAGVSCAAQAPLLSQFTVGRQLFLAAIIRLQWFHSVPNVMEPPQTLHSILSIVGMWSLQGMVGHALQFSRRITCVRVYSQLPGCMLIHMSDQTWNWLSPHFKEANAVFPF